MEDHAKFDQLLKDPAFGVEIESCQEGHCDSWYYFVSWDAHHSALMLCAIDNGQQAWARRSIIDDEDQTPEIPKGQRVGYHQMSNAIGSFDGQNHIMS